jgi:hypothetical protein
MSIITTPAAEQSAAFPWLESKSISDGLLARNLSPNTSLKFQSVRFVGPLGTPTEPVSVDAQERTDVPCPIDALREYQSGASCITRCTCVMWEDIDLLGPRSGARLCLCLSFGLFHNRGFHYFRYSTSGTTGNNYRGPDNSLIQARLCSSCAN